MPEEQSMSADNRGERLLALNQETCGASLSLWDPLLQCASLHNLRSIKHIEIFVHCDNLSMFRPNRIDGFQDERIYLH